MKKNFLILNNTRQIVLDQIKNLSIDQLNYIPKGFNNNIIWNFGHILVTQELLCYQRTGSETTIPTNLLEQYRRGTKPVEFITTQEYELLNDYATSLNEKLSSDYHSGKLFDFQPYTTSMGMPMDSIETAIMYLPVHEGMHLGYIMALKKSISTGS